MKERWEKVWEAITKFLGEIEECLKRRNGTFSTYEPEDGNEGWK